MYFNTKKNIKNSLLLNLKKHNTNLRNLKKNTVISNFLNNKIPESKWYLKKFSEYFNISSQKTNNFHDISYFEFLKLTSKINELDIAKYHHSTFPNLPSFNKNIKISSYDEIGSWDYLFENDNFAITKNFLWIFLTYYGGINISKSLWKRIWNDLWEIIKRELGNPLQLIYEPWEIYNISKIIIEFIAKYGFEIKKVIWPEYAPWNLKSHSLVQAKSISNSSHYDYSNFTKSQDKLIRTNLYKNFARYMPLHIDIYWQRISYWWFGWHYVDLPFPWPHMETVQDTDYLFDKSITKKDDKKISPQQTPTLTFNPMLYTVKELNQLLTNLKIDFENKQISFYLPSYLNLTKNWDDKHTLTNDEIKIKEFPTWQKAIYNSFQLHFVDNQKQKIKELQIFAKEYLKTKSQKEKIKFLKTKNHFGWYFLLSAKLIRGNINKNNPFSNSLYNHAVTDTVSIVFKENKLKYFDYYKNKSKYKNFRLNNFYNVKISSLSKKTISFEGFNKNYQYIKFSNLNIPKIKNKLVNKWKCFVPFLQKQMFEQPTINLLPQFSFFGIDFYNNILPLWYY